MTGRRGIALAIAGIFALLLAAYTVAPRPAFNPGDVLLALKLSDAHRPAFGEVYLYSPPIRPNPYYVYPFLGRIVGLPGDNVVVVGDIVYRNDVAVRRLGAPLGAPLQTRGAGLMFGNMFLPNANVPPPDRWASADRIPEDCYLILADRGGSNIDGSNFGFVPGHANGPCASTTYPSSRLIARVVNVFHANVAP